LRASVDGQTVRLQGAAAMRETSEELERKLAAFKQAIPDDQRIGGFLEALDQIARDAGLTGKNVRPTELIIGPEVSCLPIQVEVSGTFAAIHDFLRQVEALPRLARVQRVELSDSDDPGDELVSSVMMQVYFRPS
jgi:Tfp pilus assembly protein PilO